MGFSRITLEQVQAQDLRFIQLPNRIVSTINLREDPRTGWNLENTTPLFPRSGAMLNLQAVAGWEGHVPVDENGTITFSEQHTIVFEQNTYFIVPHDMVTNIGVLRAGQVVNLNIVPARFNPFSSGLNDQGQLGQGNTVNLGALTRIGTESLWTFVSVGEAHTLALREDGSLWAWGRNEFGQIGDGTTTQRNAPVRIGTRNDWVSVNAGQEHSAGVTASGELFTWGANRDAAGGHGTMLGQNNSPTQVGTDSDWTQVVCGWHHTMCIKRDGTLWGFGSNSGGQLGAGTDAHVVTPSRISPFTDWLQLAGRWHSLGIRAGGQLWGCGPDNNGRVGTGTGAEFVRSWTRIGTGTDWTHVSCGDNHSAGLRGAGTLWTWGAPWSGRLGNGSSTGNVLSPAQITGGGNWSAVSCGNDHTMGIRVNGQLWGFGNRTMGQLGNGASTTSQLTPVQIGTFTDWINVAGGRQYTIATRQVAPPIAERTIYREPGFDTNTRRITNLGGGDTFTVNQIYFTRLPTQAELDAYPLPRYLRDLGLA